VYSHLDVKGGNIDINDMLMFDVILRYWTLSFSNILSEKTLDILKQLYLLLSNSIFSTLWFKFPVNEQVKENNSIIFYPWLWTCCIWSCKTENPSIPGNLIAYAGPLFLWVPIQHLIIVWKLLYCPAIKMKSLWSNTLGSSG
jgi:hypothetical protein